MDPLKRTEPDSAQGIRNMWLNPLDMCRYVRVLEAGDMAYRVIGPLLLLRLREANGGGLTASTEGEL